MACNALSNSPSKASCSFSKNPRFPKIRSNTINASAATFDKPSDFNKTKGFMNATTNAFGSQYPRFTYYNTSKKHGELPTSNTYKTQPRQFDADVSTSNGWSFGVSREKIQKQHIERIIDEGKKKIASPAPVSYEKDPTFGKQGIHHSMRKKLYRYGNRVDKFDSYFYDSQKKLPGPGFYQ